VTSDAKRTKGVYTTGSAAGALGSGSVASCPLALLSAAGSSGSGWVRPCPGPERQGGAAGLGHGAGGAA